MTAGTKALNVFARANTGIVGSNPTRAMDVCVHFVFVLSCAGSGPATDLMPRPIVYNIHISELIPSEGWPESLIHKTGEEQNIAHKFLFLRYVVYCS
jgi:hypothetical protein